MPQHRPGRGQKKNFTIRIDVELLEQAQTLQARYKAEGRIATVTELVEEGLRRYLAQLERADRKAARKKDSGD